MAEPFFWGAGGKRVSSPEAAARQRAIAEALIGRSETPAQNWAQGLADVAAAWSGTQLRNQADEAEQEGQRAVAELLAGLTPESGFSDISAVMANPWSTASQSAVAQALMGNQFNRANIADERAYQSGLLADQRAYDQPVRDLGLEGARLANEAAQAQLDALLNPPPPAPVFEDGQWWDISSGTPNALTDRVIDPTANMQDYDAYAADEILAGRVPLGRLEYEQAVRSSGANQTNLTINPAGAGPKLGSLSNDYGYVLDPETGEPVIDPVTGLPTAAAIPGSPAALEAQAAAAAAASQEGASIASSLEGAEKTLTSTTNVLDLLDNSDTPVTGTLSRPFAAISGTPAGRVRSYVGTLQSGVALGAMQRLKEASATGATGFGALSAPELQLLINDIGALDPDNTEPDIFRQTIERIDSRARRVVADIKRNVSPERIAELGLTEFLQAFGDDGSLQPPRQSQANPALFGGAGQPQIGQQPVEISPGITIRRLD